MLESHWETTGRQFHLQSTNPLSTNVGAEKSFSSIIYPTFQHILEQFCIKLNRYSMHRTIGGIKFLSSIAGMYFKAPT